MDTIIIFPRGFVTSIACLKVGATPATSKDTSTPSGAISRTACTGSPLPELTACVAPNSFAFSNRSSDKSKTITLLAPDALAAMTVNNPMGPAPNTATESPNVTHASFTACTATAIGSTNAPSCKVKLSAK